MLIFYFFNYIFYLVKFFNVSANDIKFEILFVEGKNNIIPSCNFHHFITFEASILDAASTARACSRVALKCNAARLSANTFKLTPYMSLCL